MSDHSQHSRWEIIFNRNMWNLRGNCDGILIRTPFFMLHIADLICVQNNPDLLKSGIHIAFGMAWWVGDRSEGCILYKREYWFMESTVSLWDVVKHGR